MWGDCQVSRRAASADLAPDRCHRLGRCRPVLVAWQIAICRTSQIYLHLEIKNLTSARRRPREEILAAGLPALRWLVALQLHSCTTIRTFCCLAWRRHLAGRARICFRIVLVAERSQARDKNRMPVTDRELADQNDRLTDPMSGAPDSQISSR